MYSTKANEDEQIIEKCVQTNISWFITVMKIINPDWQKADQFRQCSQLGITISTTVQWEQSGQGLNSGLRFSVIARSCCLP